MKLSFKDVDEIIGDQLNNFFPIRNAFIEVNPGRVILPKKYTELGEKILKFSIRENDIWVVSFPRTGSTWAQEMVWLLGNDLDFKGAKKIQQIRAPLLEMTALFSGDHHEWVTNSIGDSVECVENLTSPRFIRSHLPWDLLPLQFDTVKPKIIYTARNPKDLCVSFYHYCKLVHGLTGTLEDFCELFMSGGTPIGLYWYHVLSFWKRRHDANILFLKYEDMKRNLPSCIEKCAEFLNVDYKLTKYDFDRMCEHLKFDKMQSNPAVNLEPIINSRNLLENKEHDFKFIRKGEIGDWKNHISLDLSRKFDSWIEFHTSGTDLQFDYE